MSYGTVMLCGHCGRPVIQGVGESVFGGDGRTYHYECARSPYSCTTEQNIYGDGNVFRGVRSVVSGIKEKNNVR